MSECLNTCLSISLADLRKDHYFTSRRKGMIEWVSSDTERASVHVSVMINRQSPEQGGTLMLMYEFVEQSCEQIIDLVWQRSNLGKGGMWYAICSVSGKRCRTLYFHKGKFVSRHVDGLRYSSQLQAKSYRPHQQEIASLRRKEKNLQVLEWGRKPHSRRTHHGRPTVPMQRFMNVIAHLVKPSNCTLPGTETN